MHILKILNITAILYIIFMIFTWQTTHPTSPRESFDAVKSAYKNNNAGNLSKLLTKKSKIKILKIISKIKKMPKSSKISFAKRFGLNVQKLSNLSIEDYLTIQFFLDKETIKEDKYHFSKLSISSISEKGKTAVINTNKNLKLLFSKEGAYWLYNLEVK